MNKGTVRIGTSGWFYGHWDKVFYPEDLSKEDLLPFYSTVFSTVEINNTFYHLPSVESVHHWHDKVGKHFVFSVKVSRYLTHIKKLNCEKESIDLFFDRIKPLKKKLGCILIQLPPSFKINLERLSQFCSNLPKNKRYTFEFRHPSWFISDTLELLQKFNIALCIADLTKYPLWQSVTADFVYIRLHGPKGAFVGEYGAKGLRPWVEKIRKWTDDGLDVFCYFDNDEKGYAVEDAKRLLKTL